VEPGLVSAQAQLIGPALQIASSQGPTRLLFSAHGLPKKVIDGGDPYQWQVEQTCAAIAAELAKSGWTDLDWLTCYQSRVGPLEWIGPSTDDEIIRAGRDGVGVVVAPIAFVSEHSETLVELDIEYRELAENHGVSVYERVPTVGISADFILGLADLVRQVRQREGGSIRPQGEERLCPGAYTRCICVENRVRAAA
jgi:ferrochelatase